MEIIVCRSMSDNIQVVVNVKSRDPANEAGSDRHHFVVHLSLSTLERA
jgi:hypothetical protein